MLPLTKFGAVPTIPSSKKALCGARMSAFDAFFERVRSETAADDASAPDLEVPPEPEPAVEEGSAKERMKQQLLQQLAQIDAEDDEAIAEPERGPEPGPGQESQKKAKKKPSPKQRRRRKQRERERLRAEQASARPAAGGSRTSGGPDDARPATADGATAPAPAPAPASAADLRAARSLYLDKLSLDAQARDAVDAVSDSRPAWRTPSPEDRESLAAPAPAPPPSFFGLAKPAADAATLFKMTAQQSEPELEPEPEPDWPSAAVCAPCADDPPPPYTAGGRTGLVFDDRMLGHRDPLETDDDPHPEQPARITSIYAELQQQGLARRCKRVEATPARRVDLERVHEPAHVGQMLGLPAHSTRMLQKAAERYDSVYLNSKSLGCALLAAGATVELTMAVCRGTIANGLAVVRPPGHHAECGCAMGFCLFNNIAVAARTALDRSSKEHLGINRVLIVDWDVHHVLTLPPPASQPASQPASRSCRICTALF
jgi:hypothetical protein